MKMLAGKKALVTGSTSGIGLAMATALADAGADVFLNGFGDPASIETIKNDLKAKSISVDYFAADMSKPDEIMAMMANIESQHGGLDILVNNAGIQHVSPIDSFDPKLWDAILAINLSSAFHTIRAALPGMKKRSFGRIVNIASVHGLVASTNKCAYIAAKHGLVGLTKTVALETAATPVTCNAICPGWVLTPLVQKQVDARMANEGLSLEEAKHALLIEKQPSGEFVQPEQLASLAVYLCSPQASQVRGVAWNMDGGWTAQ
jgi:3-hydroxybutyrate dehydrogenase